MIGAGKTLPPHSVHCSAAASFTRLGRPHRQQRCPTTSERVGLQVIAAEWGKGRKCRPRLTRDHSTPPQIEHCALPEGFTSSQATTSSVGPADLFAAELARYCSRTEVHSSMRDHNLRPVVLSFRVPTCNKDTDSTCESPEDFMSSVSSFVGLLNQKITLDAPLKILPTSCTCWLCSTSSLWLMQTASSHKMQSWSRDRKH